MTSRASRPVQVRVPHFPIYPEMRHLLRIWPSHAAGQVTGLQSTLNGLRGTPKNPADWSEPAVWIPERLTDNDRQLAQDIWDRSGAAVNPRHTYGHWLLARTYRLLLEDEAGILQLSDGGRNFLNKPGGETERKVDEAEGLAALLSMVNRVGPTKPKDLEEGWADYLSGRSSFKTHFTIRNAMHRRLHNLLDRDLVQRDRARYSITPAGRSYLKLGDNVVTNNHARVMELLRQQESTVRKDLSTRLASMDPVTFEHLVKLLLEKMGYHDVEVTAQSGDGGVDVKGKIELGITSVQEVVQAKRHQRPIQRKDLDALRGSLHRFQAVRGTIVTTSTFASGTEKAALELGAAPITLIDGEKLVDLLMEHRIGVRTRQVRYLELDPLGIEQLAQPDSEP